MRVDRSDGTVLHYEGERGAERIVRAVLPDGNVAHFEGEKGAERLLRAVLPDGMVHHYEGEKGAERLAVRQHGHMLTRARSRQDDTLGYS